MSRCLERINDWSHELRQAVQEGRIYASTAHEIHHRLRSPEEQRETIRLAANGELKRDDVAKLGKRKPTKPNVAAESRSVPSTGEANETPAADRTRVGRRFKAVVGDGFVWVSHRELSPSCVSAMLLALASRAQELCAAGVDSETFFDALREVSLEPAHAAV